MISTQSTRFEPNTRISTSQDLSDNPSCPNVFSKDGHKPDSDVLHEVTEWMTRKLPCVAGRREYGRGRYLIRNASRMSVPIIIKEFQTKLLSGDAVACLMVFNEPRYYANRSDTGQAFRFLADQMALISNVEPELLANGEALTSSFELRCPVTNQVTLFDDFECIAFCPQSADKTDPLYDPLMYAPYPCVNMSSDVYAFSRFVADSARSAWGKAVYEETDTGTISKLFDVCVDRWHRVATATIKNFEALTDTSLCPVHVTSDKKHWIAAHKDPAFAEQVKEVHSHELPAVYGKRITDRWLDFFAGNKCYQATGLARDGMRV